MEILNLPGSKVKTLHKGTTHLATGSGDLGARDLKFFFFQTRRIKPPDIGNQRPVAVFSDIGQNSCNALFIFRLERKPAVYDPVDLLFCCTRRVMQDQHVNSGFQSSEYT